MPSINMNVTMPVPPQFLKELQSISAEEGTQVTVEGLVKGSPYPSIQWYKAGMRIDVDEPEARLSYENGRVTMQLPSVS